MNENSSTPSAASATSSKIGPEAASGSARLPIKYPRWSLAARLTAWYAGSAFVLILAAICFLYWALVATLDREDDHFLADKARILLTIMRDRPNDDRELREEVERESSGHSAGQLYMRVLDSSGTIIAETAGMRVHLPADQFPAAAASETGRSAELRSASGGSFRVLAVLIAGGSGRVVQVAMDRTHEEELLSSYRWYAGLTLTIALLGCAVAGYALARRGLRPLREISQTLQRIGSSTLHERIDLHLLPVELAALAVTFNDMLNRLEESFLRLERFSADIAHELRTPVNNLRGEVEVALGQPRSPENYREILSSSLEEFGRLASLIDSLLFLARAESPQHQIAKQRLELARELATVREFYEAAAHDAGIELVVTAADGLVADLDRTLFQRAVGNLVANALAYTPRGGTITLNAAREKNGLHVEVIDTGSGISPAHLPHVFDRFYRADPARTSGGGSVGLGLALVKTIAALHGGSCTIASEIGRGTRVSLVFPLPISAAEA
jgi:two-component system heavy metal sensor histidine kinase CusS